MNTYEAVATRSGDWWAIEVPEVAGAFTQARHLRDVAATAREAVALLLEVPEADVEITVQVGGLEAAMAATVAQYRQQAADAKRQAEATTLEITRALLNAGLTQRDVAELLHVSQPLVSAIKARLAA